MGFAIMSYSKLLLVKFEQSGVTVAVSSGTDLLEAARRAGVSIPSTCNGQRECGECRLVVSAGQVSPLTSEEIDILNEEERNRGVRLACCTRIHSAVTITGYKPSN